MLAYPIPVVAQPVKKKRVLNNDPTYGRAATLVIPRLYLADFYTATDEQQLRKLGVTHIISAVELTPSFPDSIPLKLLHIPVADRSDVDILRHLEVTTAFISDALASKKDNKVLVHCQQGISRSATIVCAYLVATTPMSPAEAIAFVQAKRGIVCPNIGFRRQLNTYAVHFEAEKVKMESKSSSSKTFCFSGSFSWCFGGQSTDDGKW